MCSSISRYWRVRLKFWLRRRAFLDDNAIKSADSVRDCSAQTTSNIGEACRQSIEAGFVFGKQNVVPQDINDCMNDMT